jgi:hypothetical protein
MYVFAFPVVIHLSPLQISIPSPSLAISCTGKGCRVRSQDGVETSFVCTPDCLTAHHKGKQNQEEDLVQLLLCSLPSSSCSSYCTRILLITSYTCKARDQNSSPDQSFWDVWYSEMRFDTSSVFDF